MNAALLAIFPIAVAGMIGRVRGSCSESPSERQMLADIVKATGEPISEVKAAIKQTAKNHRVPYEDALEPMWRMAVQAGGQGSKASGGRYGRFTSMSRKEVQSYLESWGFAVYASEKLSDLRQAAYENERTERGSRSKAPFQPGDIVRYTTKFMRSTGMYATNTINAKVVSVRPPGGYFGGSPEVIWNDDPTETPKLVLAVNLELDPTVKRKGSKAKAKAKAKTEWLTTTAENLRSMKVALKKLRANPSSRSEFITISTLAVDVGMDMLASKAERKQAEAIEMEAIALFNRANPPAGRGRGSRAKPRGSTC